MQRLIAAGADVNGATPGGETPLMMAARTGDPETLKALLAHGAVVDAREGWRGQTALMWAAVENNAEAIRLLLEAGADVKAKSTAGRFTAFLFAVRGGHLDASRALLDAGADVNERLPDGMSALVLALYNAHYELAAFLLDRGADPNAAEQGWTALHQVAWSRRPNRGFNMPGAVPTGGIDSLDLVRRLVAKGAERQRPHDQGAARRQPQHAESHRRDAVRHGGEVGRRAADACAARMRVPIRRSRPTTARRR